MPRRYGRGSPATILCRWSGRLQLPVLVGAAPAGPQLDPQSRLVDVQAEPGLYASDGSVGVDRPTLILATGAGVGTDHGPVGGALAVGVQALLATKHRELAGGR